MGEVVSIKSATDDDIQALFLNACPNVPLAVDEKVQLAASRALGGGSEASTRISFKWVCVFVGCASLIGVVLVKGVTTRWNNAVDSAAMYTVQSNTLGAEALLGAARPYSDSDAMDKTGTDSWRRSRGAWAEYIARLERDPFYQYVQQEKMRFEARYPSEP